MQFQYVQNPGVLRLQQKGKETERKTKEEESRCQYYT